PAVAGAAVDGGEFTDDIAVADHQFGVLALELLVLGIAADRGVAVDAVVAADAGRAQDAAVGADAGAVADLDPGPDQGKGPDRDALADPGGRIDHGAGVDAGRRVHVSPWLPRRGSRRRRPACRRPGRRSRTGPCCGWCA